MIILPLAVDDQVIEVVVRRSPLARALSVRVDPVRGVVLVLPRHANLADAKSFLVSQRRWLAERVAKLPLPLCVTAGSTIPVHGRERRVEHNPTARRGVWMDDDAIHVSGEASHLGRRLGDFLKAEARRVMVGQTHELAARIDRKPGRITIKDTVSRWGSCSAQGHIALSWRLLLAPDWVCSYVIGHEVAHLAEMNHSPAFWAVVSRLGVDVNRARAWLKTYGAQLHRYQLG